MMMVPMMVGQYALAFSEFHYDCEGGLIGSLRRLESAPMIPGVLEIFGPITKVTPKTYRSMMTRQRTKLSVIDGMYELVAGETEMRESRRLWRETVVAVADTEGQIAALAKKLLSIGPTANSKIEAEEHRIRALHARELGNHHSAVREKARADMEAALPHIFGRTA